MIFAAPLVPGGNPPKRFESIDARLDSGDQTVACLGERPTPPLIRFARNDYTELCRRVKLSQRLPERRYSFAIADG